jgi:hypothetical protein
VLRAVDGDKKLAMPEVPALMNVAKEKIRLKFPTQNKYTMMKKMMDIIERRRVTQMDRPLYGAALYLNPRKFGGLVFCLFWHCTLVHFGLFSSLNLMMRGSPVRSRKRTSLMGDSIKNYLCGLLAYFACLC